MSGRVVDERTGVPIAGASVWAQRKQDRSMGTFGSSAEVPESAVLTGADGTFTIGQLGEGDWVVRYRHPERPAPTVVEVALKAAEQQTGLDLKLAAGARVAGRVTGLPIPPGSSVVLHALAVPRFNAMQYVTNQGGQSTELKAPLATDGTFAFSGIALANFFLLLELPSSPRGGSPLYVPIEPLRVRPDGVSRDFDASQDLPSRIRGTVNFPKAAPVGAVLVVVAEQLGDDADAQSFGGGGQQFTGPRTMVLADGTFVLPVVSGVHRLRLIDAASGVLLATVPQRLLAPTGGEVAVVVSAPLTEFLVKLQSAVADPQPLLYVDRLEVRHQSSTKDQQLAMIGGNDQYDMGVGLPVPAGASSMRLWLPEGKATLFARSSTRNIQRAKSRSGGIAPLAKEDVDIPVDEKAQREVVLWVEVAPPVDADEKKVADEPSPKKQ